MNTRRTLVGLVLAGALALAPVAGAAAAPLGTPASHGPVAAKVTVFANCTALNKVHKGGVAKAGVKYNKVSGKNKPFGIRPTFSTALYTANAKMDRDKDGIACEK